MNQPHPASFELTRALRKVADAEREYADSGLNEISDAIHTAALNMLERLIAELESARG